MDGSHERKMWSTPLTEKTYRYYAIMQFINPEKTWNAYFKALKSVESLASCISNGNFNERTFRKAVSLGNEIGESFSKEATTRIVATLVPAKKHSEAKTLLKWLELYSSKPIPEANLESVSESKELMKMLHAFNGSKKD